MFQNNIVQITKNYCILLLKVLLVSIVTYFLVKSGFLPLPKNKENILLVGYLLGVFIGIILGVGTIELAIERKVRKYYELH